MIKTGSALLLFFIAFLLPLRADAVKTPHCTDPKPQTAPVIVNTQTSDGAVTLVWKEAADPVTHYMLTYGNQRDTYIYGATNIGPKGTHTFTVKGLTNSVRYYFRVAAVNNCRPGAFSHSVSIIVGKPEKVAHDMFTMPNLSLIKSVLGIATEPAKEKSKKILIANQTITCSTCIGGPLLVAQVILLSLYFYLSHKLSFIKPLFGVSIPLILFIIFSLFQKSCLYPSFFCSYFIQVSIVLFVISMILHKFMFFHKKITPITL
jgi:hypothetical protein